MPTEGARRAVRRSGLEDHHRIKLAEDDLDDLSGTLADFDRRLDEIQAKQNQILIALVTGAILLTLNVGVMFASGALGS